MTGRLHQLFCKLCNFTAIGRRLQFGARRAPVSAASAYDETVTAEPPDNVLAHKRPS
jgi:hypothetical protein